MAELGRIVPSWFVMLQLLSFRAETVKHSFFTVRAGADVSLPCGGVSPDQESCDFTTWLFTGSGNTKAVFEDGKIPKDAEDKSDRLSVSENCSLVIKNVSVEDVECYTCRRFTSGTQEDAEVYLSVVSLTEQRSSDEAAFSCSVSIYSDICRHTVRWLHEGNRRDVVTSRRPCSAWHIMKKSDLDQKTYELLKCEVTDGYSGKVHQFPLSPPPSSGDDATPVKSEQDVNATDQGWTRSTVVVLGLAAMLTSVVSVNIWTRAKDESLQGGSL
ncbi:uncharacterized protein LOC130202993 [Pseudoliparis swirei]|uniref:uncharacterized protein LOC130202993 n=1 Tax=Pseudoliparis swirei TaxID=2059687 RepID=UPI0024BE7DD0|nr:uncharacterized protein LOC130202993 [Pseudoliparis swirei]